MMKEKEFFRIYIPALEKALLEDNINYGFSVLAPDWYIEDEDIRKEIYLFEETYFENYKDLFQNVALYFDAKSHGFNKINGILVSKFKEVLHEIISEYKKKFQIS